MTDAPERIWAKEGYDSWFAWGHWYRDNKGGGVEYVRRSDYDALAEEMTAAQGQIADAQEQITELRKSLSMAQASLVVWDIAYRTGRNEPLTHAFETGVDVLTRIRTLSDTKP